MTYHSCIDWCQNHPALLAVLLVLSIVFPLFVYIITRIYDNTRAHEFVSGSSGLSYTASSHLENQMHPRNGAYESHQGSPAWSRLMEILRLSQRRVAHNDLDPEQHAEPQEKTPLIGSTPGNQGWGKKGQLNNNWHGTNQLNTSWSYMA